MLRSLRLEMQGASFLWCSATLIFAVLFECSIGAEVGGWEVRTSHQITGTISFPAPTTLVIENFSYDDGGVEVYLYFYAPGATVDGRNGIIIGEELVRRYTNEQLVVALPSGVTACDIGYLTVWCAPFFATFSRVAVPRSLFVNGGEGTCTLVTGNVDLPEAPVVNFDNCEPFSESLQVSWSVDTDNSEVDFQICSCRPLDPAVNQYMAFGLSGRPDSTFMVGADATVAWVDNAMGMPNAVDYYLTGRVQCRGGQGACPDTLVGDNSCTDDVRGDSIVGGIRDGNQQCVIFSRPFTTSDNACDTPFDPNNVNQYIVWSNGGLGETAFIHFDRANPDAAPVHLGRSPLNRCTSTPIMCPSCDPFEAKTLDLPDDATLTVRIGPSGRQRGYMGITGQVGWGISWYINDLLVPVLNVRRNRTYTFIVEGGTDASDLSRYHPFYITNSRNGGRLQNTPEVQRDEIVYAGFNITGSETGVGRLCEFTESLAAGNLLDTCGSFSDYLAMVTSGGVECDPGNPGTLIWTPDETTPDEVFYQCATHLNLGWKINVNSVPPTISTAPPTTTAPPTSSSTSTSTSTAPPTSPSPSTAPPTSSSPSTAPPTSSFFLLLFTVASLLVGF